jgi:phosphoribosyl 1,2-cyclic phosphate phosphodiesterase
MKVTILGSGTSQGVPVIACQCEVCKSADPRDNRLRSSILIEQGDTRIVVDTGPDFRQQLLRADVQDLSAVLFTHQHKDHTAGLDDVRAFNFKYKGDPFHIYASEDVQASLTKEFAYIFSDKKYPGIPTLEVHTITPYVPFTVGQISFLPIEVLHYQLPVMGFRVGNFAYITDANFMSETALESLQGLDTLILNALQIAPHISHYNLAQALAVVEQLKPKRTYFTHIGHRLGLHSEVAKLLPPNVWLAQDWLVLEEGDA